MFAKAKSHATHSTPQLRGGGRDWSQLVTEVNGVPQVRKLPAGASAFLLDAYNAENLEPNPLQLRRSVVRSEGQDVTLQGEYTPVRRRRFLRRLGPQQLTPEQQEEAKRISKIAAKMGTDPTAIIGRVQTSYQHFAFSGGGRADNLVGSIVIPYHGEFVLRADVPHLWTDPNRPGAPKQNGLSDVFVRTGGRVYTIPGYAFFAGMDITFPTADKPQLGLGKYTVGPLFLTARVLPELKSLLFGTVQHQISVGGDPSRQDISITRFGLTVNTIWAERWWTQVEALTQVNWERKAKSSMTLEFEGGRRLTQDWAIWVRPGVGLLGKNQAIPANYEWNFEVGVRRTFTSF
jgi:hypothetical protein